MKGAHFNGGERNSHMTIYSVREEYETINNHHQGRRSPTVDGDAPYSDHYSQILNSQYVTRDELTQVIVAIVTHYEKKISEL